MIKNISVVKIGRNINSDIKVDLNFLNSDPNSNNNLNQGELKSLLPGDKIIFLASICNPTLCNESFDMAYNINVSKTRLLLKRFLDTGASVLFASSDVVYGNTEKAVNEKSEINPIYSYAEMKAEIESYFSTHPNFFVMRMSNISSIQDNTLSYFFSCSKNNSKANVYHPFIRAPAHSSDLIDFICNFIQSENSNFKKLTNICGPSFVSNIELAEIFSTNFPLNYEATTPDKAFLDSRPQKILMQSLYFDKIIKRNKTNVLEQLDLDLKSI